MSGQSRRRWLHGAAPVILGLLLAAPAVPAEATTPRFTFVEVGYYHSCALTTGGAVWCWGSRANGRLGDGGVDGVSAEPVRVRTAAGPLGGVVALTVGNDHSCALRANGTAWCWGRDDRGQLGDGTTTGPHWAQPVAVPVRQAGKPLRGIRQVSVNGLVSFALLTDGSVLCWGGADLGQCGDGTTGYDEVRLEPVSVRSDRGPLQRIAAISAGGGQHCAVGTDGMAWCWGWNRWGAVGDGTMGTDRLRAVRVRDGDGRRLTGIRQIVAGGEHTCVVRSAGGAWCWGGDRFGQLGDGTRGGPDQVRLQPTRVRFGDRFLNGVIALNVYLNSCAVRTDGSAWCWGEGSRGQLGTGGTADRLTPARVRSADGPLSRVMGISTQFQHACAVRTDGTVWCWGANALGQLGDGTRHGRVVAVPVVAR